MSIYISGKISGLGRFEAMSIFEKAEELLESKFRGDIIVNPMKEITPSEHKTWQDYMFESMFLLGQCGAICMLPNWKESEGAINELKIAIQKGFEIYYLEQDCNTVYCRKTHDDIECLLNKIKQNKRQPSITSNQKSVPHYLSKGHPYECIKVMKAWGLDKDFYLGSALKYLCRAGKKDGNTLEQDLTKAIDYLQMKIKDGGEEN